ncbi:hypothetical protein RJ641_018612 [Dillenia turbinata]|uniref:Uncharacterized protein ycf33 n=1 Tax=Dillenia turbinata TaxID=194707 RepID=A0AAN8UUI6_9MAGN
MRISIFRTLLHFTSHTHPPTKVSSSPFLTPIITSSDLKHPSYMSIPSKTSIKPSLKPKYLTILSLINKPLLSKQQNLTSEIEFADDSSDGFSRLVIIGAISAGFVLFMMGMDDQKALALGPEGPLMEEFWDNMRRYALYVLTVSTGVAYTLLQPILELLKNPISAILILTIIGGSIYIVSQVVYLMVGVNEFSYDYTKAKKKLKTKYPGLERFESLVFEPPKSSSQRSLQLHTAST